MRISVDYLEDCVLMHELPMSRFKFSGVYELVDLRTGRRYVGSSQCMLHRAKRHRQSMLFGDHDYPELAEALRVKKLAVLFIGDDGRLLLEQENERIAQRRSEGLCINEQGSDAWRARVSDRVTKWHRRK